MKVVIAKGRYSCVVRPGQVITKSGGAITFKANRSLAGQVTITFNGPLANCGPIQLTPGGSHAIHIPNSAPEGVYVYEVSCQATGTLASAGSDPEIIIDN